MKQSNVTVNFTRMCYLFYKMFSKMTHLTETQRIEILIFIGCGMASWGMAIRTFNTIILSTYLWSFAPTFLIFKQSLKTIVATILIIVIKVLKSS
jgi:hypothetical protein